MNEEKLEIRDKRNGDWYWISRLVYEEYAQKIGVIGLALYNAYASYARDKAEAWPSLKTVSRKLGISIPTILKYNKVLEEYGLIEIKSGKEDGKSNIIYLKKASEGIKQVNTPYKRALYPGIKQVNTNEKNTNEKNMNDLPTIVGSEPEGSQEEKQVNAIIPYFEPIFPAYKKLYTNKTQRAAIKRLLKIMPKEQLIATLQILPQVLLRPYAPRITTPLQLEDKLGELKIFIGQEKSKNKISIISTQ